MTKFQTSEVRENINLKSSTTPILFYPVDPEFKRMRTLINAESSDV
jgi:hypothetical protein